ncbi:MAG: hypothetical protein OEW12_08450, partial [Deltaproteobacteria bacterium]|nr:hypothetical protein [Deltaproteobacteria bacterium]
LEEAAHLLGEMAQGNPELADRWERKPATVALHYRGMTHDLARQLEQQVVPGWRELAARSGLELKPFDGGVELVAPGVDKGRAVTTILNETPEAGVAAYLGDDLTDEDAFRALHEDTASHTRLAVFVRESHRNTLGDLWLRPPEELLEFLHRWHTEAQG